MAEEENKATGSSRWSMARRKKKTCHTSEQFVQLLPLYQQQAIKAAVSEKNHIDDEMLLDTAENVVNELTVKV